MSSYGLIVIMARRSNDQPDFQAQINPRAMSFSRPPPHVLDSCIGQVVSLEEGGGAVKRQILLGLRMVRDGWRRSMVWLGWECPTLPADVFAGVVFRDLKLLCSVFPPCWSEIECGIKWLWPCCLRISGDDSLFWRHTHPYRSGTLLIGQYQVFGT